MRVSARVCVCEGCVRERLGVYSGYELVSLYACVRVHTHIDVGKDIQRVWVFLGVRRYGYFYQLQVLKFWFPFFILPHFNHPSPVFTKEKCFLHPFPNSIMVSL